MTSLPRYANIYVMVIGNINYYVQSFYYNSILIINSE